jgi:hypothetical protein
MLDKTSRLALIKSRFAARNNVGELAQFIAPNRTDVREEKQIVLSRTRDDNDVTDEEIRGVAPSIADERAEIPVEREESILLTKAERRQLAADMLARRLRFAIVPVATFAHN